MVRMQLHTLTVHCDRTALIETLQKTILKIKHITILDPVHCSYNGIFSFFSQVFYLYFELHVALFCVLGLKKMSVN